MVDLVISVSQNGQQANSNSSISAFRAFRLLRIFKLVKSWKKFQDLIVTIMRSLKDVSNFGILLCLFIFIYTLLGMELFAYKVKFDTNGNMTSDDTGTNPRINFDKFYNAFITVFIVLTGEDWNKIYYSYARKNYFASTIFFYSLIVFGQLILLNLFLAILLDNFDEVEEEERKLQKKKRLQESAKKVRRLLVAKFITVLRESKNPKLVEAQRKLKVLETRTGTTNRTLMDDRPKTLINLKRFVKRAESDPFDSLNDIDQSHDRLNESRQGNQDESKGDEHEEETKEAAPATIRNLNTSKCFNLPLAKRTNSSLSQDDQKMNFNKLFNVMQPPKTLLASQKHKETMLKVGVFISF